MYLYAQVIFPSLQMNHFQKNSLSNYKQLLNYILKAKWLLLLQVIFNEVNHSSLMENGRKRFSTSGLREN